MDPKRPVAGCRIPSGVVHIPRASEVLVVRLKREVAVSCASAIIAIPFANEELFQRSLTKFFARGESVAAEFGNGLSFTLSACASAQEKRRLVPTAMAPLAAIG